MKLHELADNPGATQAKKRVGRGPGSGTGKTGGRGVKGQKSRSGVAIKGFEGGQMPIHRRLPKRGFNNINAKSYAIVNLKTLQDALDRGAIDAKTTHDENTLVAAGVIRRPLDGVRLLAKGEISVALTLEIAGASKAAVEAVEKAGGKVEMIDVVARRREAARNAKAEAGNGSGPESGHESGTTAKA